MQQATAGLALPAHILLLAPTGSGKTLAFAIPLLRSLGQPSQGVQALVIAPTRELALQVYEVIRPLAAPEYKTVALYGGHSFITEQNSLRSGADIIVATPGRLLDHLHRGSTVVQQVSTLVFDEYDKSLELGFLDDIKAICKRLRNVHTVIMTSATRLQQLPDFIDLSSLQTVDFTQESDVPVPDIDFRRVDSPEADKLDTLENLLRDTAGGRSLVFVNHRVAAERVYKRLKEEGFPVGLYHGGLDQDLRRRALTLFVNGTTPVLVSTDLASRGLDIGGLEAVIHYHLPVSAEVMTHRNGRTGRMGAPGKAFAIISPSDKIPDFFPALDEYYPEGSAAIESPRWKTLYFNVGKKEKISRGDIVGYLINKGGLPKDDIGRIDVDDHCAYVAVAAEKAAEALLRLAGQKIKNVRAKVSLLKT